jgi:hypothetical protein
MSGPLTEHAIKAKPNEEGDQGEDNDYGQFSILYVFGHNIVCLS